MCLRQFSCGRLGLFSAQIRHEHGRNFERKWCRKHFLSVETLQTIEDMASQFCRQLYDIGFLHEQPRAKGGTVHHSGTPALAPGSRQSGPADHGRVLPGANRHAGNRRVVAAVLAAGLYPNIARVHRAAGTGKMTFTTGALGQQEVHIHPRSVNHDAKTLAADWLVFHDKVPRSKLPAASVACADA